MNIFHILKKNVISLTYDGSYFCGKYRLYFDKTV